MTKEQRQERRGEKRRSSMQWKGEKKERRNRRRRSCLGSPSAHTSTVTLRFSVPSAFVAGISRRRGSEIRRPKGKEEGGGKRKKRRRGPGHPRLA